MIAFQFRAGTLQYFLNKYIILSQRVQSARTERTAGRTLLFKANGQGGPTDWVDAMGPLIKYNSVTGRNHHDVKIGNISKYKDALRIRDRRLVLCYCKRWFKFPSLWMKTYGVAFK